MGRHNDGPISFGVVGCYQDTLVPLDELRVGNINEIAPQTLGPSLSFLSYPLLLSLAVKQARVRPRPWQHVCNLVCGGGGVGA
jgi:hypothetical protein